MRKKNEPQGKSKVWLQVASTALFSHWKIRLINFKMILQERIRFRTDEPTITLRWYSSYGVELKYTAEM